MRDRVAEAKGNVEKAIREMGVAGWTVEVERPADGYTLRITKGSKKFLRAGIDEAVLEDDWSDFRDRLLAEARQGLEGA